MIETAVIVEGWPATSDWDALASRAVAATVAASPAAHLASTAATIEISVKFGRNDEVQHLNRSYRGKDQPTNVLSFPMVTPDEIPAINANSDEDVLLGDIILAHQICVSEARERAISVCDHATHLIVHGTLHLLGYDHVEDGAAEIMEALEQAIMAALGLHDPYQTIKE